VPAARPRSARPPEVADPLPVEAFLDGYSPAHRAIANRLRALIHEAVPEATERVRVGWRVIGFDVPRHRRSPAFFAWVFPEREHVHLGFPQGVFIEDPTPLMDGAGITKRARWLTYTDVDQIDAAIAVRFIEAAVGIAGLPPGAFR
jgi:hypothetical protein